MSLVRVQLPEPRFPQVSADFFIAIFQIAQVAKGTKKRANTREYKFHTSIKTPRYVSKMGLKKPLKSNLI